MAKETAEKKLLKLIESTQAQEATSGAPGTAASAAPAATEAQQVLNSVKGFNLSQLSLPPFLQRLLNIVKGPSPSPSAPAAFGLKSINRFLIIGIVIMAGLLALNFLSGLNDTKKEIKFDVDSMPVNTEPFASNFRELKEYVQAIARRNIFQPFDPKVVVKETIPVDSALAPMNDRIKDFKLVGISWLDTPESASAMIENTQSGVTYFLKSGEQINNVMIKRIYADSIVIGFGSEEMEMRL